MSSTSVLAKASRISLIIELISARSQNFSDSRENPSIFRICPRQNTFCTLINIRAKKLIRKLHEPCSSQVPRANPLAVGRPIYWQFVVSCLIVCDSGCFLELLRTISCFENKPGCSGRMTLGSHACPTAGDAFISFSKRTVND